MLIVVVKSEYVIRLARLSDKIIYLILMNHSDQIYNFIVKTGILGCGLYDYL
ncbi:MAG: hypothetical protein E6X43_06400 [Peptostreptococcaceae bacterium]|nr:hypothetical protein [Peptostreptococcaceae bacterium]